MSKLSEYLETAIGYDADGKPASTSQFAFGSSPFQIAETENIEDVMEIFAVCHSDAIVDVNILDEMAAVSFDFSNDMETFGALVDEMESYKAQKDHVTRSLHNYMNEMYLAERNGDEATIDDVYNQMRALSVPFMLPTIMPVCFGGTVQIGFTDDPKFVFYTSDSAKSIPTKITMVFDVQSMFCRDEVDVYAAENIAAEIAAQQEELWYLEETKKLEEENYMSQFGSNNTLDDSDDAKVDKRLKGARIK